MVGKFLALLASIAGVVAFVLPFLTVSLDMEGVDTPDLEFSGLQLVQAETPEDFVSKGAAEDAIASDIDNDDERAEAVAQFNEKFDEKFNQWKLYSYVLFAPLALIVLGSLMGLAMGMSRGSGIFILLGGVVGLGLYFLFQHMIQEKPEELGSLAFNTMIGFTVYGAASAGASVAGLIGVMAPEKSKKTEEKKKKKK